jgi:hypothetical protein
MNIMEGAKRMQRAGRAIVIIALSVFVLCALIALVSSFLPMYLHVDAFFTIFLPLVITAVSFCAVAIVVGGVLWVGGWILEGFFHHTHP